MPEREMNEAEEIVEAFEREHGTRFETPERERYIRVIAWAFNRRATPPGAVRGEVNMLSFDDFRDNPRGSVTVYKKGRLGVVNVQPVEVRPLSKGE